MKINRYNVIFKPEPEGGFTVIVPSLPGCVTYGKDLTEARTMVEDAIRAYIASLRKHNESIPSDDDVLTSVVDIKVDSDSYAKTSGSYAA